MSDWMPKVSAVPLRCWEMSRRASDITKSTLMTQSRLLAAKAIPISHSQYCRARAANPDWWMM
jgi:hypothetical protein